MYVFPKRYGSFPKKIWMFFWTFQNSVKLQRNRPVKTGLQLNDQQATN